jgi:hypothetical protein
LNLLRLAGAEQDAIAKFAAFGHGPPPRAEPFAQALEAKEAYGLPLKMLPIWRSEKTGSG